MPGNGGGTAIVLRTAVSELLLPLLQSLPEAEEAEEAVRAAIVGELGYTTAATASSSKRTVAAAATEPLLPQEPHRCPFSLLLLVLSATVAVGAGSGSRLSHHLHQSVLSCSQGLRSGRGWRWVGRWWQRRLRPRRCACLSGGERLGWMWAPQQLTRLLELWVRIHLACRGTEPRQVALQLLLW
eukprot:COSAG05_NODE_5416_length_1181_cov_0.963031_1_plen_184_part_00